MNALFFALCNYRGGLRNALVCYFYLPRLIPGYTRSGILFLKFKKYKDYPYRNVYISFIFYKSIFKLLLCCLNIIFNLERFLSLSLRHQSAASSRAAVLAIRSISILVCDVTIVSCVAEAQRSNCFTVCVFAIICVSGVVRWHLHKFFPRKICEKERNFVTASR